VAARVGRWASRLTRFDEASELMACNADPDERVSVGPTLAAVLDWATTAWQLSGGVVDISLLDARLCAEDPGLPRGTVPAMVERPAWRVMHGPARRCLVERPPGVRFDLDGVAKGWIADRALDLLSAWPGGLVDADGDIALDLVRGVEWAVAVADPRPAASAPLGVLRIAGTAPWRVRMGVATSGTTNHRWPASAGSMRASHHLIDPRTRQPADTDVVQATVIARSGAEAEALAKTAVILGSNAGLRFLERSTAAGALLLEENGTVLRSRGTERFLG